MEADITAVSVIITIATITIPLCAGSRQLLLPSRGTAAGATHKQRGLKIKIFLNIDTQTTGDLSSRSVGVFSFWHV